MVDVKKIEEKLKSFPTLRKKGDALLIKVNPEEALKVNLTLMKSLASRGLRLIVLSGSRPCETVLNLYKDEKIDIEKIHILDTVCKSQGIKSEDLPQVTHVKIIRNLTDISIKINQIDVTTPEQTVLVVDSMTSMLMYNDERTFYQFIQNTLSRMRSKGINVVIVSLNTPSYKEITNIISESVDKTINLN